MKAPAGAPESTVRHPDSRSPVRAIILGVEHPRSVAAIRALARSGIPVLAVNHETSARASHSRHLSQKLRVGNAPPEVLALLDSLGRDGGGVLIPTDDDYLILVAKNFDRLSRHFVLTTPPWDILRPLLNKPECYAIARGAGLKTPRFFTPVDEVDLRTIVSGLSFHSHDYLLKTMPGTGPANTGNGRYTKVAGSDPASVERSCLEIRSRIGTFPVIEEVVPGGPDRCIGVSMVIDRNHEAVVCFCVRRLRLHTYSRSGRFAHPYELGANVYCESVHDPEAAAAARRFVRQAKYYGAITVEFRRDPTDDSLVLIKADPRLVRATSLSTVLELDIPTALYRVFTGGRVTAPVTYPGGVGWIWLGAYLDTLLENRDNRPARRELLALFQRARRIRAFAYLDLRDPLPFLADLWWRGWPRRGATRLVRLFKRPMR
jgi:predicted ATP-grasp superfamily ATP-dependent carboligase